MIMGLPFQTRGFKRWIAVTNSNKTSVSLHKHSAQVCLGGQPSKGLEGPLHFPSWPLKEYQRFPSLADVAASCWNNYTTLPSADCPFSLQYRQSPPPPITHPPQKTHSRNQQFIFKDVLNIHICFKKSKERNFSVAIFSEDQISDTHLLSCCGSIFYRAYTGMFQKAHGAPVCQKKKKKIKKGSCHD